MRAALLAAVLAGASILVRPADALDAYWLRARWTGVEWAVRYRVVADNGGGYRIVTDVGDANTVEAGGEIVAEAFGAFPSGWVRVTVEAVGPEGEVVPSNPVWLPPTVPVCAQADLDGSGDVTATDVLATMEAATGECAIGH